VNGAVEDFGAVLKNQIFHHEGTKVRIDKGRSMLRLYEFQFYFAPFVIFVVKFFFRPSCFSCASW